MRAALKWVLEDDAAGPAIPVAGDPAVAERVDKLRRIRLFEDLAENPSALARLAAALEERAYAAGAYILREGEAGSELFLLTDGRAAVLKATSEGEPYKVALLQAADLAFFGEGGLLESERRSATIRAESPCRCWVLSRDAFAEFGQACPAAGFPVALRIARVVLDRLRKSNDDLALVYRALVAEIRDR